MRSTGTCELTCRQEDGAIAVDTLRTADGRKLTYRREGSGEPLICQPGGPGYSAQYFADLAGLADFCQLVMVNARGTDASDHPADRRSYSLANYASDLEELRAHLGLKRIDLLGHSHGGMVAIVYAATHPERVGRLILSNTIARQPTEELTRWEQQVLEAKRAEPWYEDAKSAWAALNDGQFAGATELAELLLREQPLHFARYGSAEQSYVDRLRSEMPNRALVLLRRGIGMAFDLRPELRRIRARTLVITGDQDTNGPPAAEEIARAIPGGELVIIQNCGHFAFVEAPERFRAEVLAFLVLD